MDNCSSELRAVPLWRGSDGSATDASHIASKACLCMHKIRRVSLKSRNEDSLESKSPYLDRLVRMMSSQLKHWRIAIPGLPVTRLLG